MKKFGFGLALIFIASKWWLLIPLLGFISGTLAFIKQTGSPSFQWPYIIVCAIWGAGFGVMFFTGTVKLGKGLIASLLSASVMVGLAVVTGLILAWDFDRTLTVAVVGFGLGLIAAKWIPHLNLG